MSATIEYTADLVQSVADSANDHAAWRDQGCVLAEQSRAGAQADTQRQFAVGDWLIEGEERWQQKKTYKEATAIFPYKHSTLKLLAHVARRVPALGRTNALSWEHHKLVARFKPETQRELLDFAVKVNSMQGCAMTVACFRKHIKQQYPPAEKAANPGTILIHLPEEVLKQAERFAKEQGRPLVQCVEWLVGYGLQVWARDNARVRARGDSKSVAGRTGSGNPSRSS